MLPRVGIRGNAFAHQAYKTASVQTASPGQVLLKLYDGAIRFTRLAKQAIEDGNPAEKGKYINKAQAIIDEFMNALDHNAAPELCSNLELVYLFMTDQLTLANTKMDPKPCDLVLEHLENLRNAWSQAVTQAGG